jgi:hypothetical protein
LIVIEAKKGDLDKGFNRLVAELIALDKYEENEVWRFALLHRKEKKLVKDVDFQRIQELFDYF